jgi:biopolymer transport protein ExbD/biopolymer transport protein TolR
MAMDIQAPGAKGKKGRAKPEMNVTPLVDVVLVLLIIFMVLTSVMSEHFWVHVPEKDKQDEVEPPPPLGENEQPIVVLVNKAGQIQINQDAFPDGEFPERLKRMLIARGDRRVYFDAEDSVPFERAVEVMDLARGGGAAHIAVVTEKLD